MTVIVSASVIASGSRRSSVGSRRSRLRKTRFVGIERTQLHAYFAASAYNLLRMARLAPLQTQ